MSNISIIVVDPNNSTKTVFNAPDDWEARQLVPALVNHFKLASRSSNPYQLVRAQNGHILKDDDTISSIGSAANETFVLLTKKQIIQELERDNLRIPSIREIILNLVVGVFFIVLSFPDGVRKLGDTLGWSLVPDAGTTAKSILTSLFGASPSIQNASFNNLWSGLVIALLAYLGALALLSLRHQRFDLVGSGFLFLTVGTALLHLLAWIVYIVIVVVIWFFQIVNSSLLFSAASCVLFFSKIASFLVFIFGSVWRIIALLVVAAVIFLIVKYGAIVFEFIKGTVIVCGALALAIGAFYLLGKLLQFLSPFLLPILAFIGQIMGVIIRFLFILLICFFGGFLVHRFGSLLIDQFKGAWKAGNERRGVILGALAIGTSLALVLLESNLYNLAFWFPAGFPDFISHHLHQASPMFDIVITLIVIIVSIIAILWNIPKLREKPGCENSH